MAFADKSLLVPTCGYCILSNPLQQFCVLNPDPLNRLTLLESLLCKRLRTRYDQIELLKVKSSAKTVAKSSNRNQVFRLAGIFF